MRLRQALTRLLPLLFFLITGPVLAQTAPAPGADPSINRPYQDPDYQQWVYRFERPGREVFDYRMQIVAATGVSAGMSIADVGAGTGLFTRLFAEAVGPSGKVYAVDISPEFIRNVLRTAGEQGLDNVEGIVNSQSGADLPANSVDLVFISDTYHHFERPIAMMRSVFEALRPGGRLVVVDFERIPGRSSPWILGHVRAGKQTFTREIESVGFRYLGEVPMMRYNYLLRFQKPAG
jgi:ubiquinone/menaquinone biosynthesis C-methylase UbiE